jgi:Putative Actinobacterial Holin-X, holin superfamily III
MAHDRLRDSGLVQALTDLFADLADLLQKELQLAKTEITEKLFSRLRASAWMAVAGVLGLIAILLLIEAAVFGIASFGIALHWACLIVAGMLIAAGAAAFFQGRVAAEGELLPTRTAKQISQDIKVAKEQLT